MVAGDVRGQIPDLSAAKSAAPKEKTEGAEPPAAAPTDDNPGATVAATSGPIDVENPINDGAVRETLESLLSRYPGVRSVEVDVDDGVVTLAGQVEDDDVRNAVTEFVRRVKGVRLVVNQMKTDAQVLSARELAAKVLNQYRVVIAREWILALLSLAIVLATAALARLFGRYSETLLAPFVGNLLLRSVVGSILGSLLIIGGVLLALSVLNLTEVVLSILGLAGVVGLAVGFAFRDIAENFIASVLLGVRRPFRVGDYVQVAGHAGVVRTLNTRATVLVTLEGKHVRIPNATIFKEILVNSTASPSVRATFDLVIPYEVSTADAMAAVGETLREQEGILDDPPPRALVEALEPAGVRLRAYFWTPAQGVDGFKVQSDARLRAKVALQQAGIAPPPTGLTVSVLGHVPVEVSQADARGRRVAPDGAVARAGAPITAEQARANLHQDTRAAASAATIEDNGNATPMEHVLQEAESRVSDEGANLLKDH